MCFLLAGLGSVPMHSQLHYTMLLHLLNLPLVVATSTDALHRVVSDVNQRLATQSDIDWRTGRCPETSVTVLHDDRRQIMGGFGASMTEASAMNLNSLPANAQSELLELLFGSTGAKLSALKATMLCNDFSTQAPWSTYDDVHGDVGMVNFTIERDLRPNGTIPFLKRAYSAGFNGTLQAYMDFPPDWMLIDSLPQLGVVEPKYYDALALYFARYAEAYKSHGLALTFLEAFNEPADSYTRMSAPELAKFLGQHLGPLFERRGLWPSVKLSYGGQATRESAGRFVPTVMADESARKYMDVIAYHGYDCQYEDDGSCNDTRQRYDVIDSLARAYPGRALWMTEICYAYNGDDPHCKFAATLPKCTDWPRDPKLAPPLPRMDWADGPTWGHRIIKEVQAGASGWIYWNLLLNAQGGPFAYSPKHGDSGDNFQQPIVVVDAPSFRPTALFYFLAHFSRFVRPGVARLGTREAALPEGVSAVAFEAPAEQHTPNGAVLQLVNRATSERQVTVCSGERIAEVTLPATSITTAMWSA